jgi:5-formyltetrahydrofolate cyclo-ligase
VVNQKQEIRQRIWSLLESRGIARFPRPVYGRIPNFDGAEAAGIRLCRVKQFKEAKIVKVNPDAPQAFIRKQALVEGKVLIMPTPRLKQGFLLLNPKEIPRSKYDYASTIKGAFIYGKKAGLDDLPKIDLVVMGSVAVSLEGIRLGKGGGYGELEYAILRELGLVNSNTLVATTIHDLQLVDKLPYSEHDVPIDIIATPTKLIWTYTKIPKPKGIIWHKIDKDKMELIPILKEVMKRTYS